jgi:hypothetical protein
MMPFDSERRYVEATRGGRRSEMPTPMRHVLGVAEFR